MKFSERAETAATVETDEQKPPKRGPDLDASDPSGIKIPIKIDEAIIVRSLTNVAHMAKCRIVGALHGDFILITEPVVQISERITAVLDDGLLCSYFSDGKLYSFRSRYRKDLINNTACIDYPREVEVRQIRKHRRIKVNIETKLTIHGTVDSFIADMTDLSLGGCRLVLNHRAPITAGTKVALTFNLPNEALVIELQGMTVRANRLKNIRAIELGIEFTGPPGELSKIANFCEFCMFFDLE